MKPLILSVLLIFLQAGLPVPRQESQNTNQKTKGENPSTNLNKKPPIPPAVVNPNGPAVAEKEISGTANASKQSELPVRITGVERKVDVKKDWSDYAYIASTFIVALTTLFLGLTAKRQAKSIMNSERAWMVTVGPRMVPVEEKLEIIYFCAIKNVGRTPSRISEIRLGFSKTTNLKELPSSPSYTQITPFNRIVVAPNDCIPVSIGLPFTEEDRRSVEDGKLFLYGVGSVKYLDIFGSKDKHLKETRFCHCSMVIKGKHPFEGLPVRPCIEAPSQYHMAS